MSPFVQRPAPVDALVDEGRELADFGFRLVVFAIEILRSRQDAGDEQCRVDGRKLAVPGAMAGIHVQKMVEEAAVAGRVAFLALTRLGEEPQRIDRTLGRFLAADP